MGPHVEATYGSWDVERQARRFARVPVSSHRIVLVDGRPSGCLLVRRGPGAIVLSRIWIDPLAQNRGIGSSLIRAVCRRADAEGRRVRLCVLKGNPARRLYERLGFAVRGETATHFTMERAPRDV